MNGFLISGKALGKPEVKKSEGGNEYATILMKVERNFKKEGETEGDTFKVIAFKNLLNDIQTVSDGTYLLIKGHLSASNYGSSDKMNYSASLLADKIEFPERMA